MQLKEAGRNLTPNVAYKFTYYSQLAHAKGFYHCRTQLLEIDHFFFLFLFFFFKFMMSANEGLLPYFIPTLKQTLYRH